MSAPVDCDPVMAFVPVHAPEAVHEVALLADQDRVDALPLPMVLGLAFRLTVTAGFALTVTVVVCAAVPPAPLQVRVYAEVAVSAPVDCVPAIALDPDQAPEATHDVAFVDDHVSVALLPLEMALGLALKVTVGAAALTETVADWVEVPPVPVHVRL